MEVTLSAPERRLRLDPEERREQLLDAATAAFLEHGYGATTIRDIAAGAGVAPGLIYRYFSGKEEMLASLAQERGPSTLLPLVELDWGHLSLREILVEALKRIVAGFADHRDTVLIIECERVTDPDIAAVFRANRDEGAAALAELLRQWEDRGELRPGCRETLAQSIITLAQAFFIDGALTPEAEAGGRLDIDAFATRTAGLLESGCALPPTP